MFKKKSNYLKRIYKIEPITKAFIIEISLDDYNDIFNEWDPSPFKRRDIHPDLKGFLEDSSDDIPLKYPLKLCFFIPREMEDVSEEELAKNGLINYFNFIIHLIKKDLKSVRQRGFIYIFTSFFFLMMASILQYRLGVGALEDTLLEGLFIGGWVFLWEAFTLFFFSSYDLYKDLKIYKRLSSSNIDFKYQDL